MLMLINQTLLPQIIRHFTHDYTLHNFTEHTCKWDCIHMPCWCTDVSMELLRCIWRKVARKQPTSSVVNTCGRPVSGRRSFRGIEWTVMVVGVSLLRVRRPGIRCQTVSVTQLWVLAFSGVTEKHTFCEILTRHILSALEMFMRMRYINLQFTYLLY